MPQTMTLTKQEWKELADRIGTMGVYFQEALIQRNYEGKGQEDARECALDMMCVLAALNYVAEFAADKCVFMGV